VTGPVAHEVFVENNGILLEDGNGGAAAKCEVAHLISLGELLTHLRSKVD